MAESKIIMRRSIQSESDRKQLLDDFSKSGFKAKRILVDDGRKSSHINASGAKPKSENDFARDDYFINVREQSAQKSVLKKDQRDSFDDDLPIVECHDISSDNKNPYSSLEDYIIWILVKHYWLYRDEYQRFLDRSLSSIISRSRVLTKLGKDKISQMLKFVEDDPNRATIMLTTDALNPFLYGLKTSHTLHNYISINLMSFLLLHKVLAKLDTHYFVGELNPTWSSLAQKKFFDLPKPPISFGMKDSELVKDVDAMLEVIQYLLILRDKPSILRIGLIATIIGFDRDIDYETLFGILITSTSYICPKTYRGIIQTLRYERDKSRLTKGLAQYITFK